MKTLIHKVLVFTLFATIQVVAQVPPGRQDIVRKLNTIVFPVIDARDITLSEFTGYINQTSKTLDPDRIGVVISIDPSVSQQSQAMRCTLSLKNIPASALLDYIAKLIDISYVVTDSGATFTAKKTVNERYISKDYKGIAPTFFTGMNPANTIGLKKLFQENGVVFDANSNVKYNVATQTLTITNTELKMDLVDTLVARLNKDGKSGESDSSLMAGFRARGSRGMW